MDFQPRSAGSGVDCQPELLAAAEGAVRKQITTTPSMSTTSLPVFGEQIYVGDEFWGNLLGERKARCDVDVWHDRLCLHMAVDAQVTCCRMHVGCRSDARTLADSWEHCRHMMSELIEEEPIEKQVAQRFCKASDSPRALTSSKT